jgi:hypothetical protein
MEFFGLGVGVLPATKTLAHARPAAPSFAQVDNEPVRNRWIKG